jgi:signal recognition particle GTPase
MYSSNWGFLLFDNISSRLSKLVEKASKTELKGKKLENFLEEFRFILLQNDVALSVADSLSIELEKRAKDLLIPRIGEAKKPVRNALREILFDILKSDSEMNFFETLKSKKDDNKPTVIIFVGINGTGKCISANSLVPTSEGGLKSIEDIYNENSSMGTKLYDGDDCCVFGTYSNFMIPSVELKSHYFKPISPSVFWKIRNREPLLNIEFKNGRKIQVTPEHPFFTRRNSFVIKIKAEKLTNGTVVMVADKNYKSERYLDKSINWTSVKKVEEIEGIKYVYDLTIPKYHNFIANGIVVHNTTSIAKLAHLLSKKKYSTVIACSDTYRTGSIEQLEEHARRIGVKTIKHRYGADAAAVAYDAISYARSKGANVVLIDTAGRMQTNKNLLDEMKKIVRIAEPDLTILVVDALTGNDAVEQGRIFNEAIKIDGMILAKLDADAKGGSAISLSHITGKPVLFVGTGQNYDDLMEFNPKFIIDNILPE